MGMYHDATTIPHLLFLCMSVFSSQIQPNYLVPVNPLLYNYIVYDVIKDKENRATRLSLFKKIWECFLEKSKLHTTSIRWTEIYFAYKMEKQVDYIRKTDILKNHKFRIFILNEYSKLMTSFLAKFLHEIVI